MTMTRQLRIVIPGGSGQVGTILARHFHAQGHHVTVLARKKRPLLRKPVPWQVVVWDGTTLGDWTSTLDGADVLINMSGRSVNCRYTAKNRAEIKESRRDHQVARPSHHSIGASASPVAERKHSHNLPPCLGPADGRGHRGDRRQRG